MILLQAIQLVILSLSVVVLLGALCSEVVALLFFAVLTRTSRRRQMSSRSIPDLEMSIGDDVRVIVLERGMMLVERALWLLVVVQMMGAHQLLLLLLTRIGDVLSA